MIMTYTLYVPNNLSLKYIKQILTELQSKIGKSTIIGRDFNLPFSKMERSSSRPNGSMNPPGVPFEDSTLE